MGQTTMGILLGVRTPTGVVLWDDDANGLGLLDEMARGFREAIETHDARKSEWVMAKPGRMPHERLRGEARYVPAHVGDAGLVGFWVAVGASGVGGIPSLDEWRFPGYRPVLLSRAGIREAFPVGYRNARARYSRFRRWCDARAYHDAAARLFAVLTPELWITPTEVA